MQVEMNSNLSKVDFVNIFGQPVSLDVPPKVTTKKLPVTRHMGWLATGISKDALDAAKKVAGFDLDSFSASAKREKIRVKPYDTPSAAATACLMAEKAGWMACHVVEKKFE